MGPNRPKGSNFIYSSHMYVVLALTYTLFALSTVVKDIPRSLIILSLSLPMASRRLFPAGLMVIIVVLVLVHEACSTNGSHHHCSPSSCGNIRNISYPFRLEGDPKNCGDQRYTLSCENNQAVLNLYAGKYYVRQISYANHTIRVVDPGILNENDSFIPRYSLDTTNFSSADPYQESWYPYSDGMVFVKCEKPVNSRYHLNISPCIENGVHSSNSSLSHSNSKWYRYVLFQRYARNLGYLCQAEQIYLTSWPDPYYYDDDLRNISCTDFHSELLRGFELFWFADDCQDNCSPSST
jgi:hypothetical protein